MTYPICPRCSRFIPNDIMPGAYPGALSRTDNKTEICSQCGADEAVEEVLGSGLKQQSAWPIKK